MIYLSIRAFIKAPFLKNIKLEYENQRLNSEIEKYMQVIREERESKLSINSQVLNNTIELNKKIETILSILSKSNEHIENEISNNIRLAFKPVLEQLIINALDIESSKNIYNMIKNSFDAGGLHLYIAAKGMSDILEGDLWTKAIKEALNSFEIPLDEIPKMVLDFLNLKQFNDLKLKDYLKG